MPSEKRVLFLPSKSVNFYLLFSYFCNMTGSAVLNKSNERRRSCLDSDHGGKTFSFLSLSVMLAAGFL